jgi:serine/threonine protein kinase
MAPAVVSNIASRFHRMSQSSSADKENQAAREEEKQKLSQWEAEKRPLEVEEIIVDPEKKPVGHSSKLLRKADFELIKTLGTGTFARVWLVRLANQKSTSNNDYTKKVFALKILRKVDVIRLKQVEHVRNERNVLAAVAGHPFITTMVASFQDADTLYMLLDYCPGGEVFSYLRRARRFNEATSQFYAAEIVLILEFLHEKEGVAYRDLKPENILIDAEGHLKLVDFGFAKKIAGRALKWKCRERKRRTSLTLLQERHIHFAVHPNTSHPRLSGILATVLQSIGGRLAFSYTNFSSDNRRSGIRTP